MLRLSRKLTLMALVLGSAPLTVAQDRVQFPEDARIIDVTAPEWGVIPDDGIDDTAAIQRIFDILAPTSRIIYFPNGQYDINKQILLEKRAIVGDVDTLTADGWIRQQDGDTVYFEAERVGETPDDAGRLTFEFDAIEASRTLSVSFRAPTQQSNSFFFRINGGEWTAASRQPDTSPDWRSNIFSTNIPVVTGSNTLEIAVREAGFQLDGVSLSYLPAYLSNTIIQGESMDGVVLKLADFALDETNAPVSGAVIAWEPGVAQFFQTAVRDLTIDVGLGNPEIDGLRFHGNNQAIVRNVRLIGRDGSGDIGLNVAHSPQIGPALFENIHVEGFAIGIHSAFQQGSRTFQTINLENQRDVGWVNETASTIFVANLTSTNSVTAFRNNSSRLVGDGQGRVVLIDSVLTGEGAADEQPAINHFGPSMYLQNIETSGYARVVDNNNQQSFRGFRGQDGIDGDPAGHVVEEWWSHGSDDRGGGGLTSVFEDAPDSSLRLRHPEPPRPRYGNIANWVGPHMFEIELGNGEISGRPNDGVDDTPSIQAALNSGASTIYFPNGFWTLDRDITIPDTVRNFLGLESRLVASDMAAEPKIIIAGETRRKLFIERFFNAAFAGGVPRFEHAGRRHLIFRDITGLNYRPTGERPGQVFISNTVGNAILFRNQRVYARQLNIEENTTDFDSELDAKIVNDGAEVWVLGFKTENPGVHVKTINGGITEMLGNLHANQFSGQTPQYITEDSALSVVTNIQTIVDAGSTYGTFVETRDGETRTGEISGTGYVAYDSRLLWRKQKEIIIDDDDPDAVTFVGDWTSVASFPRGHIGEGFSFARSTGEPVSASYNTNIRGNGNYDVYVRWIGNWGGQPHSGHSTEVEVTVNHADGTETVTVDQVPPSDGWHLVGNYRFERGTPSLPIVTIESEQANRAVITDGIRLVRRSR